MKNNRMVSVIIPVYNVGDKLNRCIDSVLNQTFTDFEIILVDDGSTDNSGKICDEYGEKDSRVKVFHLPNGGVSNARNFGISNAKGEYISFIDSDDYVDERFIEVLYKTASPKKVDVVFSNFILESGSNIVKQKHGFIDGCFLFGEAVKNVLYERIINCDTVGFYSVWNKIFNLSFLRDNNIKFKVDMSFGEDMLFVMDCIGRAEGVSFSDQYLYHYQESVDGQFLKYRKSVIFDALRCYEEIVKQVDGYDCDDEKRISLALKYIYYINRQIKGIILNEKHKKVEIKKIYLNDTVKKIYGILVGLSDKEKTIWKISDYNLRIPLLVVKGKINLAIMKTLIIYDESNPIYITKKIFKSVIRRNK